MWRKGNPLTLLVGMQTSTATMENSVEIELPYESQFHFKNRYLLPLQLHFVKCLLISNASVLLLHFLKIKLII